MERVAILFLVPCASFSYCINLGILFCALWLAPQREEPQAQSGSGDGYRLKVAVDEVSVTFHAADFQNHPLSGLTVDDMRVFDNGKRARRLLSLEAYAGLPVRGGVLIDTSQSVLDDLHRNRVIASDYVERLLRPATDRGFVMRFDSQSKVLANWTNDRKVLVAAIANVASDHESRLGGTALFDAVYKACHSEFGGGGEVVSGNFILLFSDGMDNASHARLGDAVDECQRAQTAIYVFSSEAKARLAPGEGQRTLRELAGQSGGRIFFGYPGEDMHGELQSMDEAQRSQYRLVYKPDGLKRDGAFHRLRLELANGGVVTARSGYYAVR